MTKHGSLSIERKLLEQRIRDISVGTLCALVQLLDLKDLTTGVHSSRMVEWTLFVAKLLGLSPIEVKDVETASVLHDIGKIGVPDEILKKPGRLTAEETAIMRRHPEYGWSVMRTIPGCENASLLILHHHEMWDGAGYPAGLRGEAIPIGARIVAVTDAFDAMTSDRPYRKGMTYSEAMSRLQQAAGTQFDRAVVDAFAVHFRASGAVVAASYSQ
jgi:HD-GYP domain-containing protein (c-di-GMP phosphodiesterase class II)